VRLATLQDLLIRKRFGSSTATSRRRRFHHSADARATAAPEDLFALHLSVSSSSSQHILFLAHAAADPAPEEWTAAFMEMQLV
jgi:hypothetical protein